MSALFRRRRGSLHPEHIREIVSPRKGIFRGMKYLFLRLRRMRESPHRIALGFSFGVFASFTPLFGFHILIGVGLAVLFRTPVTAAALGTIAGNPITFPAIATGSITLGRWILEHLHLALAESQNGPLPDSSYIPIPSLADGIFLPWLVGGPILGIIVGVAVYWLLRATIAGWRKLRGKKKLQKKPAIQVAEPS